MYSARLASLGLVGLLVSSCTVVVQPTAQPEPEQPDPGPKVSEAKQPPSGDRRVEPVRRPPAAPRTPETKQPTLPPRVPAADPARRTDPPRSPAATLGIPPGQLPPAGRCRVWIEGVAPGRQARARSCYGILATAPPGSWILYRPVQYRRQVRVRYLHAAERRVVAVRAFDVESGAYLRDLALSEDDNNMGPVAAGTRGTTARPTGNPRGTTRGNSGTQGNRDRPQATGKKSPGQDRGTAAGRADTLSSERPDNSADGARGADNRPDRAGEKPIGRPRGGAVGRADPTSSPTTVGDGSAKSDTGRATGPRGDSSRGHSRVGVEVRPDTARKQNPPTGHDGPDLTAIEPPDAGTGARGDMPRRPTPSEPTVEGPQPELGIDARDFPRPGRCRVWYPGESAERQPKATSCNRIETKAPAGALILRRTADHPDVIRVDQLAGDGSGTVVATHMYDAGTGTLILERSPSARRPNS